MSWQTNAVPKRLISAVILTLLLLFALPSLAFGAATSSQRNLTISGAPFSATDHAAVSLDATIFTPTIIPAPLILLAHGFGGNKDDMQSQAQYLQKAGYVVITWSARGFGQSTGMISMDAPSAEIADISKIIDYATTLTQVKRDGLDRPIVGITGASYGGAASLLAAGYDSRVKAVVADITWNNLVSDLFPQSIAGDAKIKTGPYKRVWTGTFFAAAQRDFGTSVDLLCGRFSPTWCAAFQQGAATGSPSVVTQEMMRLSSPISIAKRILIPTLLMQGQTDTLFPLSDSLATADEILSAHPHTPLSLFWHASGHDGGPDEIALTNLKTKLWFDRYLKGKGPGLPRFEVVDQAAGISTQDSSPTSTVLSSPQLPNAPTFTSFPIPASVPMRITSPAGGTPFAISSLPGFGAALTLAGGREAFLPGQSAFLTSIPVTSAFTIIGGSMAKFHIQSTTKDATLFFSLVIRGADGTTVQPSGLVAPIHLGNIPSGGEDVTVALPAIVHKVNVGDRLVVAVSSTDLAYAYPIDARVYSIQLISSSLAIPTVALAAEQQKNSWIKWPVAVAVTFFGSIAFLFLFFGRNRRIGHQLLIKETDSLIDIENLSKVFSDGYKAVNNLSFTVERGQIVGLLGPNGAGKTTTLRMLMGLITPTEGTMYLDGHAIYPGAPSLSKVGSFIEGPGFIPYLSGRKNLEMYWKATGRNDDPRLEEVLKIAGLGTALDKKVKSYSQGMRQRLAIAQAMLGKPDLLILDEPTNGLDPAQIIAMRDVVKSYAASGKTVLISSHLLSEVENTCTHVVVMHRGQLIAVGSIDEILSKALTRSDRLEDVFMHLIGTDTQIGL